MFTALISIYYEPHVDELTTVPILLIGYDNHMHGMENLKVWLGLRAGVRVFETRSV
jgi:hypothetical protein